MSTKTYDLISKTTLAATAPSITFASIPAIYRDLVLIINGSLATGGNYGIRLNNDSGSNYSSVIAQGEQDSQTYSGTTTTTDFPIWSRNNYTANLQFMSTSQFIDYSTTDKHKTALFRSGGPQLGSTVMGMSAGRYASTSAITAITVLGSQNFNIGSTFALYGIAA